MEEKNEKAVDLSAPEVKIELNIEGKSEKKTIKVWPFIVAGAIVLIALATVLLWNPIKSLFVKEEVKTIKDYEQEALIKIADEFMDVYDSFAASKNSEPVGTNCHVDFEIDELALLLIKKEYPELQSLSILNDISLDLGHENNGDRFKVFIAPKHETVELPSVEMQYLFDTAHLYLAIPGLSDKYLDFDLADLANISEELSSRIVFPAPEELDVLTHDYVTQLVDMMDQTGCETTTVTVEEIEQACTVYTAEISIEEFLTLNIQSCDRLSVLCDEETVLGKFFAERSKDLQAILDDSRDNADLLWTTYVDVNGKIIGRKIETSSEVYVEYLCVRNDEQLALFSKSFDVEFTGSGKIKNEELNGRFALMIDGDKYLEIKPKDIKLDDLEKGEIRGTVSFTPADLLIDRILSSDPGIPLSFDIKFNITADEKKFTLNYMDMASISFHLTEYVPETILDPEGTAIDASGESALYRWLQSMDFKKLQEELDAAGLTDIFD